MLTCFGSRLREREGIMGEDREIEKHRGCRLMESTWFCFCFWHLIGILSSSLYFEVVLSCMEILLVVGRGLRFAARLSVAGKAREMGLGDRVNQSTSIQRGNIYFRSMYSHMEVCGNLKMREKVDNYGREVWEGSGIRYGRHIGSGGVMGLKDLWLSG